MNKAELITEVATLTGMTKSASGDALDAVIKAVETALAKGDKVTLVGFGTWDVLSKNERTGRNPKTGEEIKIPAKKVAKFKPGANLNKLVNG
jgi:DNA-binding protein HU-beta